MSASYIPFTFTSGTYRAKVKASYMDANNVTHTKDGKPYTFTATKTIPPEPFNISYIKCTHSEEKVRHTFEVRWDYGYLLNMTYNRRLYTDIYSVIAEGSIISSSFLESKTNEISVTFAPLTASCLTYYTQSQTRNGSVRTPTISSNEETKYYQQLGLILGIRPVVQ